jgi:hypothetical protein
MSITSVCRRGDQNILIDIPPALKIVSASFEDQRHAGTSEMLYPTNLGLYGG